MVVVAAVALLLSALYSGAVPARETVDPGAFTRWALPLITTVHHTMMAVAVGCLLVAALLVPPHIATSQSSQGLDQKLPHPVFTHVRTTAAVAAMIWGLCAVLVLLLTYSNLIGQPISGESSFTSELFGFITRVPLGRAWLVVIVCALIVSALARAVRSPAALGATTLVAFVPVVPISLIGHAASSSEPSIAFGALALHWVGVLAWVGGVFALALITPLLGRGGDVDGALEPAAQRAVLTRFSAIAGVAFCAVLGSGVVNTVLRLDAWGDLLSEYGVLILVKTALTLGLGLIGAAHRRGAISRAGSNSAGRTAWRLILVEALIMSAIIGVATALGRTPPPEQREIESAPTDAQILTGYPLPPELDWSAWVTQWRWDWPWIAAVIFGATIYSLGIRKARTTVRSWPWPRTLSWLAGLALLVYLTSSAPTIYGVAMLSVFTAKILCLAVVAPLLLIGSAPIRLTEASVARRQDGTRGAREWIDAARTSRLHSPFLSGAVLAVFTALLHYPPILRLALEHWVAAQLVTVCFLSAGLWFLVTVIGERAAAPRTHRLQAVIGVTLAGLAWATTLVLARPLLLPEWFSSMGRSWGPSLSTDQQLASFPVLVLAVLPLATIALTIALGSPHSKNAVSSKKQREE